MNPFLMNLINQGLIHGPKIPQYAQNVGRAIQKSKIPQYAQNLQNYMFGQTPQYIANKLTGTKFQPNIKGGALSNILNPALSTQIVKNPTSIPSYIAEEAKEIATIPEDIHDALSEKTLRDKINDLFDKDIFETKKVKKKKKKKKERLESKKKQRYMKEKEEPEGWHIPETPAEGGLIEMKKGGHAKKKKKGYTKKQRKRKHYMASGFVKMKKKKKYIT